MVPEQNMMGTVIGDLLGVPGTGRRVTFGILHVFAFRDDLVRREQLWIDSGSLVAQLRRLGSPYGARRHPEKPGRIRIAPPNSRR
jgi:hypothetical protein